MEKFVIQGGTPLSGEITAAGNKNAALPILAACLLTEEELVIGNVPRIRDVESMLALLERLGVKISWSAENEVRLQADSITGTEVDEETSTRIRASFLAAGPLLARFGEARMPPPGGDTIGRRRLDAHLDAFRDLGAKAGGRGWIEISAPPGGLKPTRIFMDEPSVMGTENALLAAALTTGPTTIANAASEPHVQDLARLLAKMGAEVDGIGSNVMTVHGRDKLGGADHRICPDHIEIASFMALAAALTPGATTIQNAASEPHVQDLARVLTAMGAKVDGIGSNVMTVNGRDRLGGAEHRVVPDHIEIASFMALAAATGGELRVRDTEPDDLEMIRRQFRRLGLQSMVEGLDVLVPPAQKLAVRDDEGDAIAKIDDGPWPAFPADLTSIVLALATQAEGTILIFEKMFENRLFFVDKLVAMGARITLCDPHRAIVSGPSRLHGARLESPDIRAGMAMLIAAFAAEGTSEIGNVAQIDRGYEQIDLRLRDLGARVERVATEKEKVPA
ncbi:MAG: UDP-N-acetylglucosamine 1-carboxyvinyltransferase [Solirubrobacterales bacterium]